MAKKKSKNGAPANGESKPKPKRKAKLPAN
jgi:hypothetical protein